MRSQRRPKQESENMKITSLKQTCSSALMLVAALTVAFSSVSAQAADRTIQGAWRTMVTPVNCQTGDPLGPPFRGLLTFNVGGTMSEYGISPGLTPALRSPGHGVWQHVHGWQDYSYTFTFYRYDASGVFIGSQKVTSALELGDSGDQFTTNAVVRVLDANDNVIATFCARAAGTRFE
jgi:hypothetical protein